MPQKGTQGGWTRHSLEVDETKPLAYVVADHEEVRLEQAPTLRARRIVELESIVPLTQSYLKYEGLIDISEQLNSRSALELVSTLIYPPT